MEVINLGRLTPENSAAAASLGSGGPDRDGVTVQLFSVAFE